MIQISITKWSLLYIHLKQEIKWIDDIGHEWSIRRLVLFVASYYASIACVPALSPFVIVRHAKNKNKSWFWKLDLLLDLLDLGYNQLSGRISYSLRFTPQFTIYLNMNDFDGSLSLDHQM